VSIAKYICLRVFFVPIEDHLFTEPASHEQRVVWLQESFLSNRQFKTHSGTEYVVRVNSNPSKYQFFGKISKRSTRLLHTVTPDDIQEEPHADWPYVPFYADLHPKKQKIVIEYLSSFMPKIRPFVRHLSEIASREMFRYGYSASFATLNDESSFWDVLDRSQGIYSIRFRLTSPNIFGASAKANEALKQLQRQFHNNSVEFKLTNDLGELVVPHDEIDDYREYVDRGGGEWEVTEKRDGRKRKINSAQRARKSVIDTSDHEDPDTLRMAMERFEDIE